MDVRKHWHSKKPPAWMKPLKTALNFEVVEVGLNTKEDALAAEALHSARALAREPDRARGGPWVKPTLPEGALDRDRQGQRDRVTAERQTDREAEGQRDKERQRERERQRDTKRARWIEIERERERDRETLRTYSAIWTEEYTCVYINIYIYIYRYKEK